MFSKWQLLTKLRKENRGGQNNTENKLLLLKGLMCDRMKLREKQAFERWRQLKDTQQKRDEIGCVIRKMLVVQKLLARKDLHDKWTGKAQMKLSFQRWKLQSQQLY